MALPRPGRAPHETISRTGHRDARARRRHRGRRGHRSRGRVHRDVPRRSRGDQRGPAEREPATRGTVDVTVDSETNEVCVLANTNVPDTDPIIHQHIHQAPAGANGPIVIPFDSLLDCATADPRDASTDPRRSVRLLLQRAHRPRSRLAPCAASSSSTVHRSSRTTPTSPRPNEVPPNTTGYTGTATINVNTASFEVCVNATTNIPASDPIVMQHIHQAPAGVNGPIVIPFSSLNSCAHVDRASSWRTSSPTRRVLLQRPHPGLPGRRHPRPARPRASSRRRRRRTPADVIVVVQPRSPADWRRRLTPSVLAEDGQQLVAGCGAERVDVVGA